MVSWGPYFSQFYFPCIFNPACFITLSATEARVASQHIDQHVLGGVQHIGPTNNVECILACQWDTNCSGVDWDANDNTCWFHTKENTCNALVAKVGCSHYRLIECPVNAAQVVAVAAANPFFG